MAKHLRSKMKRAYQADPMPFRLRQISTILGMLDDLRRIDRLIDADVHGVEQKEAFLPIRMALTERGTKLRETIGTLEARLAYLQNSKTRREIGGPCSGD